MIPTDLQYYNGEDELTSLDKSIQHIIKPLFTTYYYKGVTFSFMPCTLSGEKVLSKLVVNNEAVDFTVGFEDGNDDLVDYDNSDYPQFLEALLSNSDDEVNIRQHIENKAFVYCLEFYEA